MKFYVQDMYSYQENNVVHLVLDGWNDWWTFRTLYTLWYVDDNGDRQCIGNVKIGAIGLSSGSPDIPSVFCELGEKFFSLGQSDTYYEKLKKLGDNTREKILRALNDVALDEEVFKRSLTQSVTSESLLRSISTTTVRGQFRRLANGGARLTKYEFKYQAPVDEKSLLPPLNINFQVEPESNPPTNIHVVIGRNGVGKTYLVKNMINSLLVDSEESRKKFGEFADEGWTGENNLFANLVCVAFSVFDDFPDNADEDVKYNLPYVYIGVPKNLNNQNLSRVESLTIQFTDSIMECRDSKFKIKLWGAMVNTLESDPIFKEANIKAIIRGKKKQEIQAEADKIFNRLSSGHKIILLTLTRLVETVEERTLVLLDEPELHLHPPLLSAFIRALSNLLIYRNGVAIITTHSPVILQEVPKRCVWKIRRTGHEVIGERLEIETFGENIGLLTNEVFGLEVTNSGFHAMLLDMVNKYMSYERIIRKFKGELGKEARAILKILLATKEMDDE